jgi:hypothetical protein
VGDFPGKHARTLYPISWRRLKTNWGDVYSLTRADPMFTVVTSIRLEVGSRRLSQLEADERFSEHLSFVGNNTAL